MPLITVEELNFVLDESLTPQRFNAIYKIGLRVISAAYLGNPEETTGYAAEVVAGVLFGVLARIVSNPKGARQLNAGGAGLTFGGADADISAVFSLTDDERRDLAAVSPGATTGRSGGAFTIRPGF